MIKKILFRCDAGEKKELGTGHLIRSISLAKMLVKYENIKKKNIMFLVKTNGKFSISKKILNIENFTYKTINETIKDFSIKEAKKVLENNFELIIIDRLGKINRNFIKILKKYKKKIICFDVFLKKKSLCDMTVNPLIFNKEYKIQNHFSGHKFNILPSNLIKKKLKKKISIKKVFLSFGGYDSKNLMKITRKILNDKHEFKILKVSDKIKFNSKKKFFEKMQESDLVISSGGLTMFDALNFHKPVIAIPQYHHQRKNIKRLSELGLVKLIEKKEILNLINIINKMDKKFLKITLKKIKVFNKKQEFRLILKKIKYVYEYNFSN